MTTYLVIGPHCWGKGSSIEEAKRNALAELPSESIAPRPCLFITYETPEDAYVDGMGRVCWKDSAQEIKEVDRVTENPDDLSFSCSDCKRTVPLSEFSLQEDCCYDCEEEKYD
jgi:hypothetical protein